MYYIYRKTGLIMKIDAINVANVYGSKKSYATKMTIETGKFDVPEIQNDEFKKSDNLTDVSKISSPAFMGKKGAVIGGLLGLGAGATSIITLGAAALTGGLTAPTIATIALAIGGSAISGAIAGDAIEGDDPDDKPPQYGGSSNDGIDPPYCP